MSTFPVIGFDRPAALYELANAHGVHVGSMRQLEQLATTLQSLALVYAVGPLRARELIEEHGAGMAALDALAQENEKLGLCGQTEGK
jgi:hypothetical protein